MFFWKHNRNPKYKKGIAQPEDIEELGVPSGRKDLIFGKYLFSTVGIFIPCACFQFKRTIFFKWPEKASEDVRAFVKKNHISVSAGFCPGPALRGIPGERHLCRAALKQARKGGCLGGSSPSESTRGAASAKTVTRLSTFDSPGNHIPVVIPITNIPRPRGPRLLYSVPT